MSLYFEELAAGERFQGKKMIRRLTFAVKQSLISNCKQSDEYLGRNTSSNHN